MSDATAKAPIWVSRRTMSLIHSCRRKTSIATRTGGGLATPSSREIDWRLSAAHAHRRRSRGESFRARPGGFGAHQTRRNGIARGGRARCGRLSAHPGHAVDHRRCARAGPLPRDANGGCFPEANEARPHTRRATAIRQGGGLRDRQASSGQASVFGTGKRLRDRQASQE